MSRSITTATTRAGSRTGSRPMTRGDVRSSPTPRNAMSIYSAKIRNMAGWKTRFGNIQCRTGPISAHSCAPRDSSSTDRAPAQVLEHVKPERTREVRGCGPRMVDLGDQGAERHAAFRRDLGKLCPEGIFQRHRGAMAVDGDRAFAHGLGTVAAARRLLNLPCRCHMPCVYTAANNPSRTTNGYPQRRDHRARRPWQDHAGRLPAEAERHLPRKPAG